MKGKEKCRILKEIRQKIADENDIPFVTAECKHQGDCRGTCPRCEAELQYLENELARRRAIGKRIVVAGLVASFTLSGTACSFEQTLPEADAGQETQTEEKEKPHIENSGAVVEEDYGNFTPGAPLPPDTEYYIEDGMIRFYDGTQLPDMQTLTAYVNSHNDLYEIKQYFVGVEVKYIRIAYAEYLESEEEWVLRFSDPHIPTMTYDENECVSRVFFEFYE